MAPIQGFRPLPSRAVRMAFGPVLAFLLMACSQPATFSDPPLEDDEDPYVLPSTDSDFDPEPSPSATMPPTTPTPTKAPPNPYLRPIGRSFLQNWLNAPAGLATDGDAVLIADADKTGMLGAYSAVQRFGPDGGRFGMYYQLTASTNLPPRLRGVTCDETVLYALGDDGLFGFHKPSARALNLGKAYLPGGNDVVMTAKGLWIARHDAISGYLVPDLQASGSIPVQAAGLGSDGSRLLVAAEGEVRAFDGVSEVLRFDGKGTDGSGPGFDALADVAADPKSGDLYALDARRVVRFDRQGRYLSHFGDGLVLRGVSLAVGSDGKVYVSDSGRAEVHQFGPPAY